MNDIYESVRRILWEEWDPIGVNKLGGPDDEYDSYASGLAELVITGRDEHAIEEYLVEIETNSIGLSRSKEENNRRVAGLLAALRST